MWEIRALDQRHGRRHPQLPDGGVGWARGFFQETVPRTCPRIGGVILVTGGAGYIGSEDARAGKSSGLHTSGRPPKL